MVFQLPYQVSCWSLALLAVSAVACSDPVEALDSPALAAEASRTTQVSADIAVANIDAVPSPVLEGDVVTVYTTLSNLGTEDVPEHFTVTLDVDGAVIGSREVVGLSFNASTTLVFEWDPTGLALGTYLLTVAHDLEDDDLSNNALSIEVTMEAIRLDLEVREITVPAVLSPEETLEVIVEVWNDGNTLFPETSGLEVTVERGGEVVWEDQRLVPALEPGMGTEVTFHGPQGLEGGEVTVTAALVGDDDDPSNDFLSATVLVADWPALEAEGSRVRGVHTIALEWAEAGQWEAIDILREGALVATVSDTGQHTDTLTPGPNASYFYQVCFAGTPHCSNVAEAQVGPDQARPLE